MIFRYPEQEWLFKEAPIPLQVVARALEDLVIPHGIEPIVFRVIPGASGPETKDIRRIEIQCGPFLYSQKLIGEVIDSLHDRYGVEMIVVHRRCYAHVPERIIIEIPQHWVEQPKVFLAKHGYIKGGNHA